MPVAKVTRAPAISGVATAPSRVALRTAATASLATRTIDVADETDELSAGLADWTTGAVLSTRTFSRVWVARTAPIESRASARTSYVPSETAWVSKAAFHGPEVSVSSADHEAPPEACA